MILFAVIGAKRKRALFTVSVENIFFKENVVASLPKKTMKHSNLERPLDPLISF